MTTPTLDAIDQLRWLAQHGAKFALPYGRSKKDFPEGWTEQPHTLEEAIEHAKSGQNVGLLTGAHSGGLVALDRDINWAATLALFGEEADTWRILRDNAQERGKLLFRCTGELPPSRAWKPKGEKHPHAEMLSNGRHALIPPSMFDRGRYLLVNLDAGIRDMTLGKLNGLWFLITGEFLTPQEAHESERDAQQERRDYIARVKAAWTPEAVFRHFGKVNNGTGEERGEVRLLGNAGLLLKDALWYCHGDTVGGDNLDAWHYCLNGSRMPRNDKRAFWDTVDDMAQAAGVAKPRAATAGGNGDGAKRHEITEDGKPLELQTDMGNAARLARLFGGNLRYVDAWGWLHWDGSRWQLDATGEVMRVAKDTARTLFDDGLDAIRQAEQTAQTMQATLGMEAPEAAMKQAEAQANNLLKKAKERLAWAIKSQDRRRLEAMLALARSDAPIPARAADFDADPWLLNVKNGALNLRTGELVPHAPERLCTKLAPVTFDADAQCPTWHAFLHRIFDGDSELIDYLQRWLGYCLTGHVSEQFLHTFWGSGANGKTVLIGAVLAMLGDYAAPCAPDLLLARDGKHPTEVADLQGRRFVVAVETDEGRKLAEGLVKSLTGGDKIKARRMREDFWEFAPSHKLALVTNHKPRVTGTDHAIWRRLRLVPFEVTIPEEEQDKTLPAKLERELPGILAWCVRGCLEWQRRGLDAPEKVRVATAAYKAESDHLASFLAECIIDAPGTELQAKILYQAYSVWCDDNGQRAMSGTAFGLRLGERGLDKYVHPRTTRTYYLNIALEVESAGSRG